MPNNMVGRGLTDREMVQLCLELEKGRCRSVTNTLLETSHEKLRAIYRDMFEQANNNHYKLYQIMEKKGWYETGLASVDQISKTQDFMQNNLHPDDSF